MTYNKKEMTRRTIFTLGIVATATLLLGGSCFQKDTPKPPPLPAPKLSIFYNTEEQPGEKSLVAQTIQAQLKEAGIEVSLDPVPSTVFNDRLGKGKFQSALMLWFLDYDDAEGFLTDFYSKSSFRASKYKNDMFDKTYLEALFAPNEAQKLAKYHDAEKVLSTDLPWIPLYSNSELYLINPMTKDFRANAYQYYDYRWVTKPNIRVATDIDVQTLDPAMCYDAASKHLITQSYEGLVAMGDGNKIVPSLATKWEFSSAKDKLTFTLRPGVPFHPASFLKNTTNRTVTAKDVKFSFERLIKVNSPYGYLFDHVVGIDEFKNKKAKAVTGFVVEGPLTFSIKLKKPFPTMLPWLLAPATYILPAEMPEKYDFSKGSCGTGPFVLNSWNGSEAKFTANSRYYLKEGNTFLPKAKSLSIRVIKDANTNLLAYKNGEIDILNVPLPLYESVLGASGEIKPEWKASEFREVRLNNLKFIAFNMEDDSWGKSPDLRRRVYAAINRDEIVQNLFKGKARPTKGIIPEGLAGF
jgi:ABC-type transport system substrate-binding protein